MNSKYLAILLATVIVAVIWLTSRVQTPQAVNPPLVNAPVNPESGIVMISGNVTQAGLPPTQQNYAGIPPVTPPANKVTVVNLTDPSVPTSTGAVTPPPPPGSITNSNPIVTPPTPPPNTGPILITVNPPGLGGTSAPGPTGAPVVTGNTGPRGTYVPKGFVWPNVTLGGGTGPVITPPSPTPVGAMPPAVLAAKLRGYQNI